MLPLIQLVQMCRTKDTRRISELVFIVNMCCSLFWFAYFYRLGDFLAMFPSFVGTLTRSDSALVIPCSLIYLGTFFVYKYGAKIGTAVIVLSCTLSAAFIIGVGMMLPHSTVGDGIITWTAMVWGILIALSPFQKIV